MAGQVRIGTSGWVYRHWRQIFYPAGLPQAAWFGFYARHFSTVEINNSFYRLPSEAAVDRWRNGAPNGFVYAVKANRYITHVKRLHDCAEAVERFLDRMRLLGPHLGPILYQLPPNWKPAPARLAAFADLLPDDLVHVFEFRDPRWFDDAIRKVLEQHKLAFCRHDHEGLSCPDWQTGRIAYLRYHGSKTTVDRGYSAHQLRQIASAVRDLSGPRRPIHVYFNNDANGCAVSNARDLSRLLGGTAN